MVPEPCDFGLSVLVLNPMRILETLQAQTEAMREKRWYSNRGAKPWGVPKISPRYSPYQRRFTSHLYSGSMEVICIPQRCFHLSDFGSANFRIFSDPKSDKWKHLWGTQITSIDPEYKWEVNYTWLMERGWGWNITSQTLRKNTGVHKPEKMRKLADPKSDRWKHLWGMQITFIDPEYKWEVNYTWLMEIGLGMEHHFPRSGKMQKFTTSAFFWIDGNTFGGCKSLP
ncbi:hypothetical protein EDB85DRAFT_1898642 [Lactarius pseudohatsudake]|nr:hypothetical protein EDB85DRAFT_1898642 [Lactarius pseudohatsudake]